MSCQYQFCLKPFTLADTFWCIWSRQLMNIYLIENRKEFSNLKETLWAIWHNVSEVICSLLQRRFKLFLCGKGLNFQLYRFFIVLLWHFEKKMLICCMPDFFNRQHHIQAVLYSGEQFSVSLSSSSLIMNRLA